MTRLGGERFDERSAPRVSSVPSLQGEGARSDAPPDDAVRDDLPPDTMGVATLARTIQGALRAAFPRRFWLVGEVSELERARARRSPHWFFRLVEEDEGDGKTYVLGAVLWASDVRRLFGRGGVLDGVIDPKDGIRVRALCDVDYYPPSGDLRLVVRDIDPAFTLGRLAVERRQRIERLAARGVFERQKRLLVPAVALRVGLITAENSAAYRDFVEEVRQAGLGIRILHVDARMQGEETVRTVKHALATLERLGVDVICLIRGGGSAVDLAWFDAEELVLRVAECRTPVWTGIGHEIDSSIADLASHRAFKTPTAVAAALSELGRTAVRGLTDAVARLGRAARSLDVERERLAQARGRVVRAGRERVGGETRQLRADARLFETRAAHALASTRASVRGLRSRLRALPTRRRIEEERRVLNRFGRSARAAAARRIESERERASGCDARARLLDPAHVLRRGFAIVRDVRGRVLKDAARVAAGRKVVVELRDGRVRARVERREPEGPETRRDGDAKGGGDGRPPRQLEIW